MPRFWLYSSLVSGAAHDHAPLSRSPWVRPSYDAHLEAALTGIAGREQRRSEPFLQSCKQAATHLLAVVQPKIMVGSTQCYGLGMSTMTGSPLHARVFCAKGGRAICDHLTQLRQLGGVRVPPPGVYKCDRLPCSTHGAFQTGTAHFPYWLCNIRRASGACRCPRCSSSRAWRRPQSPTRPR